MRVLHTEWSTGWGGQEIRILTEMDNLKRYGVESFLACRKEAMMADKARDLGIEVRYFDFNGKIDFKTIFGLKNYIKEKNIQILNSHSGIDTWNGGIAAKLSGIKFIRTRHIANPINSSRLNFINSLADFVMTTGHSIKENMISQNRINPKKIDSVPTGIDENIFDNTKYNKAECRKFFNLEEDTFYVGNLAVLRSQKAHEVFLEVARKAHEEFKDIKFVIAGDGVLREKLEGIITQNNMQDYVKMLGHIDCVAKFLKAIDIFMLTSRHEGVPQSLMQALFMNKPSIATNVGSTADLLHEDNFICVDFDTQKIYLALKELLENKDKLNSLQNNSQDFIRNNHNILTMTEKIFQIYNKILSNHKD